MAEIGYGTCESFKTPKVHNGLLRGVGLPIGFVYKYAGYPRHTILLTIGERTYEKRIEAEKKRSLRKREGERERSSVPMLERRGLGVKGPPGHKNLTSSSRIIVPVIFTASHYVTGLQDLDIGHKQSRDFSFALCRRQQ